MNIEINRLQTFNEWPAHAEVNPQRIAKAGFFATKQGLEVECFACHLKISEWNYGDQVMARHAALSSTCPFVTNPITSGNIPILSTFSVPTSSSDPYSESVEARLASFENWPSSNVVSPESLANAGFFYLGDGDNTKCAFCKGVVRAWEQGDNPDHEHKRHFPNCPYVTSVINKRCGPVAFYKKPFTNAQLVQNDQNLDELGIQTHKGPKRSDFSTVESRLRSFIGWSSELIQTPELLAQAGFYYEGIRDQVRCFHCDGGLKHWDPHDDPWTEHARWFPTCAFVKLVKGQDYVTACARNTATFSEKAQFAVLRAATRPIMDKKRPLTEPELQEIVDNFSDFDEDIVDFADESKGEEEVIQYNVYDSESEQSAVEDSDYTHELENQGDKFFYIGKDEENVWKSTPVSFTSKTRSKNIIKILPGSKGAAKKQNFARDRDCKITSSTEIQALVGALYIIAVKKGNRSHSIQKIQSTRRKYPITEQEVQAQLSSPQAMAALNIGLTLETVKRAIREKLEQTGIGYSQADALVEAALNIQHEHVAEHDQDALEPNFHVDCAVREAIAPVKPSECHNVPVDVANEMTEQVVEESVRPIPSAKKTLTLEEENRLLKEARLCKICMDAEVGIVFLPCGHLVTCVNCAPNLEDCPVCRSAIKASVRTFLA
ncbi:unnamed protein product [Acanthoscelides obtectus]|uniref:RING-type domain-containing protein n=2 Tax=Acanthoscelides obtectus TaxID=200917 RepID=A0A9P0JYZ9_ACAOB|nr:unnamed protein product [Acanthoscelides obtectus]CAK1640718.1 Death-associated inhibitor of apoptosis 2 [Acanthoscelides obtectus]